MWLFIFLGMVFFGMAVSCAAEAPMVRVRLLDGQGQLTGVVTMKKVIKTDAEWRKQLTRQQYDIARGKGTEPAFCGNLYNHKEPGVYFCVCCDLPLFSSDSKYDSGTGWPSYFAPIAPENIITKPDLSHGMQRTEVLCARCDAHLGHVFDDGPKPTGLRYCLNSASLVFVPKNKLADKVEKKVGAAKAAFAAGCFWGVEETFRQIKGVGSTQVGYSGGSYKNPTYEDVCSGKTGHAETVEVTYDPAKVSYDDLLKVFWNNHDPTTPNRQGPDVGAQYRSVIFYYTQEQKAAAIASKEKLEKSGLFKRPIVTQIVPAPEFYPAEEYHQRYLEKNGLSHCGVK